MTYTITLEEMEFKAYHGCYDLEKVVGNRFLVNITLDAELDEAAQADDVTKTINYLRVYAITAECMKRKSDILENVTLRIIDALYAEFPQLRRVCATVSKLAPPLGGKIRKVSVTLCR
ncbi:MAG TPA: dihydroneopterin aldolase [Candidatus Tidjanibacter gallistercoris]|nr:dihydroneopterin aldolase [Candidatus Tidjanibacter gallistercoris]